MEVPISPFLSGLDHHGVLDVICHGRSPNPRNESRRICCPSNGPSQSVVKTTSNSLGRICSMCALLSGRRRRLMTYVLMWPSLFRSSLLGLLPPARSPTLCSRTLFAYL